MGTVIYDKSGGYSGYLGNSLFQVASVCGIATKNGMECIFPHKHYYDYFEAGIPIGETGNIQTTEYKEPYFHYAEVQLNPQQNYNLKNFAYGGFQSWRYFEHCKDLIELLFTFKKSICNETLKKYSSLFLLQKKYELVFLHVRRGDFLNQTDRHPVCSVEYYNKAIEYIKSKKPESIFVVISNDVNWCKQNLVPNSQFVFTEGNDQDIDMCLMSLCDSAIIANSSMSWWGAWLIKNKDKIIIYPEVWFGEASGNDTKDLCLKEWIKI